MRGYAAEAVALEPETFIVGQRAAHLSAVKGGDPLHPDSSSCSSAIRSARASLEPGAPAEISPASTSSIFDVSESRWSCSSRCPPPVTRGRLIFKPDTVPFYDRFLPASRPMRGMNRSK